LAVLVQEPRLTSGGGDQRFRMAAVAVRDAALRTLTGLEGLEVISPEDSMGAGSSVEGAARAVAADEVVSAALACEGAWCRVSLRRQRGRDARVLADSGSFDVSGEPEDALALSNAVAIHLRESFSDHRPRTAKDSQEVRRGDYVSYLTLRQRSESGAMLAGGEIDALEQIGRSSPGLPEALLLAAGAARVQVDRPRAERILREGENHHRDDPRFAYERFLLEFETGKAADAEAAAARLEALAPGDVNTWRARARLLSRQGQLQEAAEVHRRLLRERPSWKNLWYVAEIEMKLGDAAGARRHLAQLLEVSPDNLRGRTKLAELEYLMGDPAEAAGLYADLLNQQVTAPNVGNLGWSLLLARDYAGADSAYRWALELKPDDLLSRLNLGIAREGLGDGPGAQALYRGLLERLEARQRQGALTVAERLLQAQALARLGARVDAVAQIAEVLKEANRDPQVLFQAALIYAVCEERNNAIVYAREARRRGLSPSWFSVPGFDSVRGAGAWPP
jgi:tetratricopeptide (TPR) repeat protein